MRFKNSVVVVTGAASGLGRETARAFAREGARLILVDRNSDKLREIEAELGKSEGDLALVDGDVSVAETALNVKSVIRDRFGRLDVLFNNAGINPVGSLLETDEETWDLIMGVNLKGPYLFCHHLGPIMVEQEEGVIVNTASIAAFRASKGESAYGISKAALVQLTKTLARDLAPFKVRVNALCPGFLPTVTSDRAAWMTEEQLADRSARAKAAVPWGREGSYEEYARFVLFMADSDYEYMTGACVQVDGAIYA